MDIQEFQQKLTELCDLAEKEGNRLDAGKIRSFFEGMDLDHAQLLKILQYLKRKGITVPGTEEGTVEEAPQERKQVPLTPEEEEYYRLYMEGLKEAGLSEKTAEELFEELAGGDEKSRAELISRYLPVAAELARDMNCEEIPVADLIQEANIALLSVLGRGEPVKKTDAWLRLEIRKGIIQAIEEQTQQKYGDEQLVEKVQKLENAIRELSEDEEDEDPRFSINELAIILDMEIDEIRDILRLTGDEN